MGHLYRGRREVLRDTSTSLFYGRGNLHVSSTPARRRRVAMATEWADTAQPLKPSARPDLPNPIPTRPRPAAPYRR
jgi:hypothetical protein